MFPDKGTVSLDKACAALEGNMDKTLHKSDDDAAMTMDVFSKMLCKESLTFGDFSLKYAECGGMEAFITLVRATDKRENALLRGKKIAFSRHYEKNHFREMLAFIQLLKNNGARYCASPEKCDFFVRYDVLDED